MAERIAIVGTAQSWKQTPWTDLSLKVWSLNDAYRLKGFARADRWYDLHPLNKFYHPEVDGVGVYAHQVPAGNYVRPADHLAWMAAQPIPIFLHPDYATQHPAAASWAHAHPFPKAAIEAAFGRYFTSSPAWMVAHALMEGAKELHIYGIHLATEHEYIEQRPNFEYLCGRLLGPQKVTTTVHDGLRRYETADGLIVLPESSPILSSDFQYAFETRPRAALEPLRWDAHRVQVKRERVIGQLRTRKWWQAAAPLQRELERLDAWSADLQEAFGRLDVAAKWI